ncbi:hypothetical protein CIHG_02351 [Coccidioides immitis H538.4]|uniref:Uncharacterized protein n=1 Tax=Coccidioides immitis H538.4 TaxID=396776 RepID=A0A0J8RI55_COCIT|nr:hypothetical protein CIHG_02351 [Coccidioides immitis H538.4]
MEREVRSAVRAAFSDLQDSYLRQEFRTIHGRLARADGHFLAIDSRFAAMDARFQTVESSTATKESYTFANEFFSCRHTTSGHLGVDCDAIHDRVTRLEFQQRKNLGVKRSLEGSNSLRKQALRALGSGSKPEQAEAENLSPSSRHTILCWEHRSEVLDNLSISKERVQ